MSMGPPPPPPGSGPQDQPGQPFGQQYLPYFGGYAAREHPQGTIILVLGILSLVACGLLGPVAWVMGNNALAEIDANPAAYSNRGTVQAGRICGIVGTALLALGLAMIIIGIAVAAATSSS
ncbi:MAG TPA: DUF4190 domain-containing protein [Acidimicrobiales bacterium]|nr:DUF4190 domain-containing protein [Acidimicrobiales bacterium]